MGGRIWSTKHAVDLEPEAIVLVTVQGADRGDTKTDEQDPDGSG